MDELEQLKTENAEVEKDQAYIIDQIFRVSGEAAAAHHEMICLSNEFQ